MAKIVGECSACGANIKEGMTECPGCGAKLVWPDGGKRDYYEPQSDPGYRKQILLRTPLNLKDCPGCGFLTAKLSEDYGMCPDCSEHERRMRR